MIIDTFPFNKDFNALEIRYNELKSTVDLFVVSESSTTHSGLKKDLHLTNAAAIRRMMGSQLVIVTSNSKPRTRNPRTREMLQRQEITKFIKSLKLSTSDLIIHSDCDEIPRASVLSDLRNYEGFVDVVLELDNFANYLNTRDGKWARCRVQSFGSFRSVQHMRADIFISSASAQRRHRFPVMRLTDFWSAKRFPFNKLPELVQAKNLQVIPQGGWHFNNLMEEHEIVDKIRSSSHVEWNTDEVRDCALVNYRNGCDIYTGKKHEIVKIDNSFPDYITRDITKWANFIFR